MIRRRDVMIRKPFVAATLFDRPMLIFLHYWGTGQAEKLAAAFKAAVSELGKHGGTASR